MTQGSADPPVFFSSFVPRFGRIDIEGPNKALADGMEAVSGLCKG